MHQTSLWQGSMRIEAPNKEQLGLLSFSCLFQMLYMASGALYRFLSSNDRLLDRSRKLCWIKMLLFAIQMHTSSFGERECFWTSKHKCHENLVNSCTGVMASSRHVFFFFTSGVMLRCFTSLFLVICWKLPLPRRCHVANLAMMDERDNVH